MRLLKVVLTGLVAVFALAAGLVITALVAAGSILMLAARRLFRHRPTTPMVTRSADSLPTSRQADVIDVRATEVSADPPAR